MSPGGGSLIEKAEQIKQQLVEQEKQKKAKESLDRADIAQQELDAEIEKQKTYSKESGEIYTASTGAKKTIEENKKKRTKLQAEGKQVIKTLRSSPETKNLFKRDVDDSAVRTGVFEETITELKNLNEETKKSKKVKQEADTEYPKKVQEETDRRTKLLAEFRTKYPEYQTIIEKNSRYEMEKNNIKKLETKLHDLESNLKDYASFSVSLAPSSYPHKVFSATLNEKMQQLRKEADTLTTERRKLEDDLRSKEQKGKGFFESTSSFEKKNQELKNKIDALYADYNACWDKDKGGIYKLNEVESKLRDTYYDFEKGLVPDGNRERARIDEFIKEHPALTIGELFGACYQNIQEYKKKLELPQDEEMIMELHRKILNG